MALSQLAVLTICSFLLRSGECKLIHSSHYLLNKYIHYCICVYVVALKTICAKHKIDLPELFFHDRGEIEFK